MKYTGIIANCIMLDNTLEISAALNTLAKEGCVPTRGEMREAVTRGNVTFPAVFSLAYDPFSGNLEHKVGSTGSQKRGEIIVFPLLWPVLETRF